MAKPTIRPLGGWDDLCANLYVFHPDSVHGWTDLPGGRSEVFVMHFREVPEELQLFVDAAHPLRMPLTDSILEEIFPQLTRLREAGESVTVRTSLLIQALLVRLVDLAIGDRGQSLQLLDPHDRVELALHWMRQNIHMEATVEQAAQSVGVSPTHLRRLFSDAGRLSPKAELVLLKMESAKRGLEEGWSQQYVADYLGYSDVSTFARAFRKECGLPPGEWLKAGGL